MFLKKVVAIVVLISILLSSTASLFAQDASDQQLIADRLNNLGVLTGDGNGNYNLNDSLKRTEAATFITKLMGKYEYVQNNKNTLKKTVFKDIKEADWFAAYVGFCYKNGIIAGYNGNFGVKDNLTEQAFLVMLLKLLKFTDNNDIKWNDNVFKKAYEVGLVTDKTYLTKTKDVKTGYTRGQAALIMNKALETQLKGENSTLLQSLINEGAIKRDVAISSGFVIDTVVTNIQEISPINEHKITIKLNEATRPISKDNIKIYEADNKSNSLNVSTVAHSGNQLEIGTDTQLPEKVYKVEIVNVEDLDGNISTELTGSFNGYAVVAPQPTSTVIQPPIILPLAVDSVKALNPKQIEVKFNIDMDKSSVQDVNFYEVRDRGTNVKALTSGAIELIDSKTAIITLNNSISDRLTNATTSKVKVKKAIKAASGEKLAADKEFDVLVQDSVIPSVIKAESTSETTIKITFSEPVYDGTGNDILFSPNFSVKSGTYTYHVQTAKLLGNTITLTLGSKLIKGPVVVTVNAAGFDSINAIRDYAGYIAFKSDTSFTYANETTVSVVTVKEAKQNSITLFFPKPIKAQNLRLFHSVKDVFANMSTPVSIVAGTYVDEITFTFANMIPAGTVSLVLVNSSVLGEEMVDINGVKLPDQTLTATVVDLAGPFVSKTVLMENFAYKIYFNEEVSKIVAENPASYTFKSLADNKDVFFIPTLDSTNKIVTLDIPTELRYNNQYQIVVKNSEDLYGNKPYTEFVATFTTGDNIAPTVIAADCFAINADGRIFIKFSKPMNEAQMLDKSNYLVATSGGVEYVALGTDDNIFKLSDTVVLIDLVAVVDTPNVKIAPIMDLSGKSLNGSSFPVYLLAVGEYKINIESADLIAKNKIKVVFSKELAFFDSRDLLVVTGSGIQDVIRIQAVESMLVNYDNKSELILVLDKELSTDATYNGSTMALFTILTPNSKSVSGNTLIGDYSVNIGDRVAPEVSKYDYSPAVRDIYKVISSFTAGNVTEGSTGTVTIYFSEAIDQWTLSTLSFKVDGYDVTDINAYEDGRVVLNVKAHAYSAIGKPTVTQVYNICDTNLNIFAAGSEWQSR